MDNTTQPSAIKKALLAFFVSLLLAFLPLPSWLSEQNVTEQYFQQSLQQTLTAYAAVRVLNASVSVIQESQVQVQPAGLGLSLALGQVLDPLNDMTERASTVLVWSAASLGVQKLLYEVTDAIFRPILAILFMLLAVYYAVSWRYANIKAPKVLVQLVVALLILRLFLPVSALISQQLQQQFFLPKITQAKSAINVSFNPKILGEVPVQQNSWEKLLGAKQSFSEKAQGLQQAFDELTQKAERFIDNLLLLMTLYVGLFLLQLMLPIIGIYILWRLLKVFV